MTTAKPRESWVWRLVRAAAIVGAAFAGWTIASPSAGWVDGEDGAKAPTSPAATAAPRALLTSLDGAVVIGASVSDGFGTTLSPPPGPTGTPSSVVLVNFAEILAAVTGRDGPVASSTSSFFFQRPDATAEAQLAFAKSRAPKVVFAIDYLFWHSYGGGMREEDRPKALERGLARLSQIDAPIVIADLPDMSHAVGMMLSRSQVPKPETLAALNARIREWAEQRGNVIILPMSGVVADAAANKPVTLGGRTYAAGESRALLTAEGLHASVEGETGVAIEALDRLVAAGILDPSVPIERNIDSVKTRLLAMKMGKQANPANQAQPTGGPETPGPGGPGSKDGAEGGPAAPNRPK